MQSQAYFAPLVLLPVVITGPGQYFTRLGEPVTIKRVSTSHDRGCMGTYPCGTCDGWHKSGRLYAGIESGNDIVRAA